MFPKNGRDAAEDKEAFLPVMAYDAESRASVFRLNKPEDYLRMLRQPSRLAELFPAVVRDRIFSAHEVQRGDLAFVLFERI